jgi:hypothetical protein
LIVYATNAHKNLLLQLYICQHGPSVSSTAMAKMKSSDSIPGDVGTEHGRRGTGLHGGDDRDDGEDMVTQDMAARKVNMGFVHR